MLQATWSLFKEGMSHYKRFKFVWGFIVVMSAAAIIFVGVSGEDAGRFGSMLGSVALGTFLSFVLLALSEAARSPRNTVIGKHWKNVLVVWMWVFTICTIGIVIAFTEVTIQDIRIRNKIRWGNWVYIGVEDSRLQAIIRDQALSTSEIPKVDSLVTASRTMNVRRIPRPTGELVGPPIPEGTKLSVSLIEKRLLSSEKGEMVVWVKATRP